MIFLKRAERIFGGAVASGVGADALLIGKLCSVVVWGLRGSVGRSVRLI